MTNELRGKLLYSGKKETWKDTIRGQRNMMVICIFSIIFVLFLIFTLLLGYATVPIPIPLVIFLELFIIFFFVFILLGIGFEIDAIYENGVTNRYTSLKEFLQNKRFHRFEDITKIGYGINNIENEKSEFIVMYEKNSKDPTIPNYTKIEYKNNFYEKLIETLKPKCPNAIWKEVDWMSLPITKK